MPRSVFRPKQEDSVAPDPMAESRTHAAASLDINALLEFSRVLNEADNPAVIYNNVLLSLMGKLALGRAAVALPDGMGGYSVAHAKGNTAPLQGVVISEQLIAATRNNGSLATTQDGAAPGGDKELLERGIERVVPIVFGGELFAVLLLGPPIVRREGGTDEGNYIGLISAIAAMALEGCRMRNSLRQANRRLERRVHRLRSLFEAGKEFNVLLDREGILRLLGYTLMGEMTVSKFAVLLYSARGEELAVNRFGEKLQPGAVLPFTHKEAFIVHSPDDMAGQVRGLFDAGVRASIPMKVQDEVRGVLLVGKRLQYDIDDEDLEYLSALANQAITALENSRLLEEMIEKKRMEEDLKIAWEIQQQLLPKTLPTMNGFELAAETVPSQQVGGDCYDVIDLGTGRVLVTIADVSGKGTPASLLMANVQAALRALSRLGLPLTELVARINDVIYENTAADKFITAFFGVIDTAQSTFTYVNAGHNPPFHFSGDACIPAPLHEGGLILGIMPTVMPYESGSVTLAPGDRVVIYTDGVSEALDPENKEYGEERLCSLVRTRGNSTAAEMLTGIREDVLAFTRGRPQSDDITIITLRALESDC